MLYLFQKAGKSKSIIQREIKDKEDHIKFLEMKNMLDGINSRQDNIEEKISKCEGIAIKTLKKEIQRAKLLK